MKKALINCRVFDGLEVPSSKVTLVDEPVMGCLEIAQARLGIIDPDRTGHPA